MRLIFVGSSQFGQQCLIKAISLPEIEVVGIITNPVTFPISYQPEGVRNVLHANFQPIAEAHEIPTWMMAGKMNDPDLLAQIRIWQPDFILVVGWYHMIPRVVRDIAPVAGLHASLLPDYSGGAPLVWAIINDEEKTGITFFLFNEGVDSGPIIGQTEVPIYFKDTIATLYARIEQAGLHLLEEYLPKIVRGEALYMSQDESKRRLVPQRSPKDCRIDWGWPARQIYNFIRAQTKPYPGAFTFHHQEKIKIWKASFPGILAENKHSNGAILEKVVSASDAFAIKCGDGQCLWVHQVGLSDDSVISGAEFIAKKAINIGDVLTNVIENKE